MARNIIFQASTYQKKQRQETNEVHEVIERFIQTVELLDYIKKGGKE